MRRLWLQIEQRFDFRPTKDYFFDVLADLAVRAGFHPVRDYLDSLAWDGTPRLDTWLSRYGQAEDTDYTRAVGAITLIAAVRRVRKPGCKFDEMLILECPTQGTEKSSALQALVPVESWFTDNFPLDANTQRVIEALSGRWIVEAPELKGMRGARSDHLKAMLSRQVDRARMSYERMPSEFPRQCVIVGTTNQTTYLTDLSGNRRFWGVRIVRFDSAAIRADRDQLWAEAAAREAAGESIRLSPDLWAVAEEQQLDRLVSDPLLDVLSSALGDLKGKVLSADLWMALGPSINQNAQEQNARVGEAMRAMGWDRTKRRFGGQHPENCYVRGNADEQLRRVYVWRNKFGVILAQHEEPEDLPF